MADRPSRDAPGLRLGSAPPPPAATPQPTASPPGRRPRPGGTGRKRRLPRGCRGDGHHPGGPGLNGGLWPAQLMTERPAPAAMGTPPGRDRRPAGRMRGPHQFHGRSRIQRLPETPGNGPRSPAAMGSRNPDAKQLPNAGTRRKPHLNRIFVVLDKNSRSYSRLRHSLTSGALSDICTRLHNGPGNWRQAR